MTDHVTEMTLDEIRQAGIRALARELGPYGLVQFLKQFETGRGDYTKERDQYLPQDLERIIQGVRQLKEQRRE